MSGYFYPPTLGVVTSHPASPATATRGSTHEFLEFKNVKVDLTKHQVTVNDKYVELTLKEFKILSYLLENLNVVITRDQLVYKIWGYDFEGDSRTVDVHINTLRKKMGFDKDIIKTIRGVGYIIND